MPIAERLAVYLQRLTYQRLRDSKFSLGRNTLGRHAPSKISKCCASAAGALATVLPC